MSQKALWILHRSLKISKPFFFLFVTKIEWRPTWGVTHMRVNSYSNIHPSKYEIIKDKKKKNEAFMIAK